MNDIASRIKLFLTQMGIANSLFADVCGIPRPSFSQLLNGRNKKVSNEVIDKIHRAYPELSMMWLMFGDGEMLVPNANTTEGDENAQQTENTFPGNSRDVQRDGGHAQHSINFDDDAPAAFQSRKAAPTQRQSMSISDAIAVAARGTASPAGRANAATDRRITSVVVVFNDGSTQVIVP